MTQGKSEQSGLICWSCDADLPAPLSTRQPVRSAADNRIKQQNGADEYPRGSAWEQGLPGQKQELPLPSHKPSLRQGHLCKFPTVLTHPGFSGACQWWQVTRGTVATPPPQTKWHTSPSWWMSNTILHTVIGKKTAQRQLEATFTWLYPWLQERTWPPQATLPPLRNVFFPACFQRQAGGLISLECCPLVWGFDSEKIQGIVQGGGMSDWFRVLCVDVELLNEAVMLVWGWRASCPAASWASFCCGGLTEPKEEAHFRVIYYHPNTSCLLWGFRKAPAIPSYRWNLFPLWPSQSPTPHLQTYSYSYYVFVCVYTHTHICISINAYIYICSLFTRMLWVKETSIKAVVLWGSWDVRLHHLHAPWSPGILVNPTDHSDL